MANLAKVVGLILVLTAFSAAAKNWDEKQQEVWNVILSSYQDIDKRDANWSDKWVTADAMVWSNNTPMPRDRDSIKRWDTFQFSDGTTSNVSEYSPTAILVHGDTAVAHYYYSNGTTSKEGKQSTTHGRCSDILGKEEQSWKFIAWNCADQHKKE